MHKKESPGSVRRDEEKPSDLPQDLHHCDGGALTEDEGSTKHCHHSPHREHHPGGDKVARNGQSQRSSGLEQRHLETYWGVSPQPETPFNNWLSMIKFDFLTFNWHNHIDAQTLTRSFACLNILRLFFHSLFFREWNESMWNIPNPAKRPLMQSLKTRHSVQKRRPRIVVYLTTIQKNKDDESWSRSRGVMERAAANHRTKPKPELKW